MKDKSKESIEHKEAKEKLYNLLINNQVNFSNQFGKEFSVIPKETFDDVRIEAFAFRETGSNDPLYGDNYIKCKELYLAKKLHCKAIFDIGLIIDNKYSIAFEIVKSHHCTNSKINFCSLHNIKLIEVYFQDILDLQVNETLNCVELWWIENCFNKKILRSYQNEDLVKFTWI